MPIRVLVVDDSAFMRRVIGAAIVSQPDMQLVGTAKNGLDALLKVEQWQPDVVTLDVQMPEMDGLTALRHLMARYPRPVVMVSSVTQAGAIATIRALHIGAVDFVSKPTGAISLDFQRVQEELLMKVRVAAIARVRGAGGRGSGVGGFAAGGTPPKVRRFAPSISAAVGEDFALPATDSCRRTPGPRPPAPDPSFDQLVVIGASTGGPRALGTLLGELPDDGRTAYLIVQHMPAGFTRSLAERLDSLSSLSIREATAGDRLAPGLALVAPGDHHLRLTASGQIQLDETQRVHGVRPSIDVALASAAEHFGRQTLVAILTGMGHDGAAGAAAVRAAGGSIIAEHESTCVVYGMPRAVVEHGVADRIVPLDGMAEAIIQAVGARGLKASA